MGRFLYWITERESIRLRRLEGRYKPWTTDPILRQYRFCNIRRMDDVVSRWLLDNWYGPYKDHPNTLFAASLARFFNLPSTLGLITGMVYREGPPDWSGVKRAVLKAKQSGPVFNAAYMVRGNDGPNKVISVVDHNVRCIDPNISRVIPSSMEATCVNIRCGHGFGMFMAGQVTADLRWAIAGDWADRHSWAPLGPGSRRGLHRLTGLWAGQEEFVDRLRGIIEVCHRELPSTITGRLEAMDYQNCLCEFDKYERTRLGEGQPKRLYPGV
jgi:hypothetical protein